MFIGRYYHTLETNGRVSLPKEFRSQEENWVVTRGLDGGLFLFRTENFNDELAKISLSTFTQKHNRDFARLLANDAVAIQPDALGRVQLPEYLITLAHLSKHVVIVGSGTYLEIWDRESYHTYIDGLESAENIATKVTYDR